MVNWDDSYNLGVENLDKQHQSFFELVNTISEAASQEDVSREEAINLIARLRDHVFEHFSSEEEYFLTLDYPNAEKHIEVHNRVRSKLADYFSQTVPQDADLVALAKDMAKFTEEWIAKHILEMDQEYVGISKKKN